MNKLMTRLMAGVALAVPCVAHADDETSDYIKEAWRGRLISMAPACGKRDRIWAERARQAVFAKVEPVVTREKIGLGLDAMAPDAFRSAIGAVAMAEHMGGRLAKAGKDMAEFCKGLVSDTALANTDALVASADGKPSVAVDPTGPDYRQSDAVWKAAWLGAIAEAELLCHRRDQGWTNSALAAITSPLEDATSAELPPASDQQAKDLSFAVGYGAQLMAIYYADRMYAILGAQEFCPVNTAAGLAEIAAAKRESDAQMDRIKPTSPDD